MTAAILPAVQASVNDFIIKAAAAALRSVPEANAYWAPDAVKFNSTVDVAFAAATPAGLGARQTATVKFNTDAYCLIWGNGLEALRDLEAGFYRYSRYADYLRYADLAAAEVRRVCWLGSPAAVQRSSSQQARPLRRHAGHVEVSSSRGGVKARPAQARAYGTALVRLCRHR